MIEVVFFDAGETLLRPEPSFPELATRVISERGHAVSVEEVLSASRSQSHHFRRAEGTNFSTDADASRAFWLAFYTDVLGELGIDDPDAPEALFDTFSDPASYGLFADARPTLEQLADRGYRLGIISNFEGWLADLLEGVGIHDLFDVVAISGVVGHEKPDPRIFEWATGEADADPSACLHVGDQPYFDAEAAIACGLHGVLLDRHDRWGDIDADYPVISELTALVDVVEGARR